MKRRTLLLGGIMSMVLCGSVLSCKSNVTETKALNKQVFDYSTTSCTTKLKGADALKKIIGSGNNTNLAKAEEDYLNDTFEIEVDDVSNKNYNFAKIDGKYWVEAFVSGSYKPSKLHIPGATDVAFSQYGKQYIAMTNAISLEGAYITYATNISIHPDDANALLTTSYNIAKQEAENIDIVNKYNADYQLYSDYLLAKNKYDQYVADKAQYDADLISYNQYLKDLEVYNEQVEINKNYQKLYADYCTQLEAYNSYKTNLDAYNSSYAIYEQNLKSYSENLAKLNHIKDVLKIITTDFDHNDNSMLRFINSGSVINALLNTEGITDAGVEREAVELAASSTIKVKSYLNSYVEIADAGDKAIFDWYNANKSGFRPALYDLTKCLESFYGYGFIRSKIQSSGKAYKYVLLVAELMYLLDAITDGQNEGYFPGYYLNASRKIGGEDGAGTYPEVLKTTLLDTSMSSELGAYPEKPTLDVTKPTVVNKPVEPIYVENPVKPIEVLKPVEPTKVVKPDVVSMPVNPNITLNGEILDLANAYKNNLLSKRKKVTSFVNIEFNVDVNLELAKEKNVLVLLNTKNGESETTATCESIVYFSNVDELNSLFSSSLTSIGLVSNVNSLDSFVNSWKNNSPSKTIKVMNELDLSNLIAYQFNRENLKSFTTHFVHVIDNAQHSSFETIDDTIVNAVSYERFEPEYAGGVPTHVDTYVGSSRAYTYKFVGFDYTSASDPSSNGLSGLANSEIIANNQGFDDEITVYVVFEKIACFDVTWNGENLTNVISGSLVNPSNTPTKEDTNYVHYEFEGWKVNGGNLASFPFEVKEKVDFTSSFKEINKYEITFEIDGVKLTPQIVIEGETPDIPNEVIKKCEKSCFYKFTGWDKEVHPATKNETYVALFEKISILDPNSASIFNDSNSITITAKENSVDVKNLFTLMKTEQYAVKPIVFNFESSSISLGKEQVNNLVAQNIEEISLKENELDLGKIEFKLGLKNSNGEYNPSSPFTVKISKLTNGKNYRAFEGNDRIAISNSSDSNITLQVRSNKQIILKKYFSLSFDKDENYVKYRINSKDSLITDRFDFENGTIVSVEATLKEGFNLNGLYYYKDNGVRVDINENKLTIDNSNIILHTDASKIVYTINCYVDGVLIKTINAEYGSKVVLPTEISKPATDEYTYTFVGWDKEINVADQDYELHAIFEAKEIKQKEEKEVSSSSKFKAIAIAVVAAIFAGVIITLSVVLKKRKPQTH